MNTPMQSLKNQFSTMKSLLPSSFTEVALNKSEDRTYIDNFCGDRTEHTMLGVKSDFIKLFNFQIPTTNSKILQDSYHLGFSFHYLDLQEKDWTVSVSLKVKDNHEIFYNSSPTSIDEFRKRINQFNSVLEDQTKNKEPQTNSKLDMTDIPMITEQFTKIFDCHNKHTNKHKLKRKLK